MSTGRLEELLRNFPTAATRITAGVLHETWRFEFEGKAYYLYFYPRRGRLRRAMRANPAHRQFFGLQTLQKISIPSPRAVAQLSGFRIDANLGDAVIVEAIEPSQPLDRFLLEHHLRHLPIPHRRHLALQIRTILHQLGRAGLGHRELSLSSFLVSGTRILLRDGSGLHDGGLRERDVMRFAHEAARFATVSELRRGWMLLMPDTEMPKGNPRSPLLWRRFLRGVFDESELFGRLKHQQWKGVFTRRSPFARRWAPSGSLEISHKDWAQAWPTLLEQMERGELGYLKRDASGEVMSAQIMLAGKTVGIVIKRPRRKFWWTWAVDAGRPARARRTWIRAWQSIVRNLPTEWPILLMERRKFGYVTDAVIVFEAVTGTTLDQLNLDALPPEARQALFRRAGKALRQLEESGLGHYDAKSTNWMITHDEQLGPVPVMIDLYGIEPLTYRLQTFGIRRLLRAMQQHPQYTAEDSLALCQGFAPFSPIRRETEES